MLISTELAERYLLTTTGKEVGHFLIDRLLLKVQSHFAHLTQLS